MRIPADEADSAGAFSVPTEGEWHECEITKCEPFVTPSGTDGWNLEFTCREGKIKDTWWWTEKARGISAKKALVCGGAERVGEEIDIFHPFKIHGLRVAIFAAHEEKEGRDGKTYRNAVPDFSLTVKNNGIFFGYQPSEFRDQPKRAQAEPSSQPPPPPPVDDMPF